MFFIQSTSFLIFLLCRRASPYAKQLHGRLVGYPIALISVVPALFGLTYYIFNFGLIKKALLTALTMSHLSLFLPMQILLQAMVQASPYCSCRRFTLYLGCPWKF